MNYKLTIAEMQELQDGAIKRLNHHIAHYMDHKDPILKWYIRKEKRTEPKDHPSWAGKLTKGALEKLKANIKDGYPSCWAFSLTIATQSFIFNFENGEIAEDLMDLYNKKEHKKYIAPKLKETITQIIRAIKYRMEQRAQAEPGSKAKKWRA